MPLRQELRAEFDTLLADRDAYAEIVRREAADLPDGRLLCCVMPSMAYANAALADDDAREAALERMDALIRGLPKDGKHSGIGSIYNVHFIPNLGVAKSAIQHVP